MESHSSNTEEDKSVPHEANLSEVTRIVQLVKRSLQNLEISHANAEKEIQSTVQELLDHDFDLEQQKSQLEARKKDLTKIKNVGDQDIRANLRLFMLISDIHWDYEATDKIAGYISRPRSDVLRSFSFDPAEKSSSVEVADKLWSLMN